LDILDASQKQIYQGWTSGYTVEAILIQLQSFLFNDVFATQPLLNIIQKQNVQTANAYRCPN
jgi:ubiquitin-protein ligase